ncbi:VWA domain-containing protein [Neobacillus sp. DY30]|uniref:vWA domain-containing protein n=1 Tax=Neobacillus sp. DY30 TaxID=3047871 RepID=UPI0024BF8762|nr:VWA domain-containing protein [Neobacillus sp. DY30]WHX98553.1 VWA domain-containing protein [Neobacillus sp. DY30]
MKRHSFLLLLLIVFVLTACSNEKESATTKSAGTQDIEQADKQANGLEEIKKIKLEVSEDTLMSLPPGTLMDVLSYEEDSKDLGNDIPKMDPAIKNQLPSQLEKLTKNTDDLDTIKKGLLALLASPHYKQVIEKSHAYQPKFEEPYLPDPTRSEGGEEVTAAKKAIILLDASSSMLLQSDGRVKMDIAKEAVKSFAQTIGQSSEVSLVVYGHKGSEKDEDMFESCSAIEELYPIGSYSKKEFNAAVDSIESKGWTPLAGAIQKAAEMSSNYLEGTTIYIVSDGTETCEGNPIQASRDLAAKNSSNSVNIIGFDVDGGTEDQLKAVAEAGNGEYFKADSPEELKNTIQSEWLPSTLDLAWAFTMAPDGWEVAEEYKMGEQYPLQLWTIGSRESHRLRDAIMIMGENKWITDEQQNELRDWAMERSEAIKEVYYVMYKENREKADAKSKEIRQRVDEWVEKMKVLKQERGDIW